MGIDWVPQERVKLEKIVGPIWALLKVLENPGFCRGCISLEPLTARTWLRFTDSAQVAR